jgi:hypothetical protein
MGEVSRFTMRLVCRLGRTSYSPHNNDDNNYRYYRRILYQCTFVVLVSPQHEVNIVVFLVLLNMLAMCVEKEREEVNCAGFYRGKVCRKMECAYELVRCSKSCNLNSDNDDSIH